MKFFASALLMLLMVGVTTSANAQKKSPIEVVAIPDFQLDEKTGQVSYSEVVTQEGSMAELYKKLDGWFRTYYKNPSEVIQEASETDGKMSGKHRFYAYAKDPKTGQDVKGPMMLYSIDVVCKDGRYKYTITDIKQKGSTNVPIEDLIKVQKEQYNAAKTGHLVQVDAELTAVIQSLKETMAAPPAAKVEDW